MTRPKGTYEWSREHNSFFEIDKLQLIDFSRKKEKDPTQKGKTCPIMRLQLDLTFSMVTPSPTHKLLGLILDQELHFKQHIAHAIAKGTSWTLQLQRLAKSTQGLSYHNMYCLYQSIAIPKMLYTADIWYTPIHNTTTSKKASGLVGFMNKLVKVQHTAALYITGVL